tara:strand:+ start:9446 stop:9736 length:291 start_codon:yes stop_codon:yes gene_type:complete
LLFKELHVCTLEIFSPKNEHLATILDFPGVPTTGTKVVALVGVRMRGLRIAEEPEWAWVDGKYCAVAVAFEFDLTKGQAARFAALHKTSSDHWNGR